MSDFDCECRKEGFATGIICRDHLRAVYCYYIRHHPKVPAVYMLMQDGVGVYVGHTGSFFHRMRDHLQQGKDFDSVMWTAFKSKELAKEQERDILKAAKVLPKYNRSRHH
jgi:hypothetical protein